MSGVSEIELVREARRVLRKMDADGALLVRLDAETFAVRSSTCRRTKALTVASAIVAEFKKRGWLIAQGAQPESYALGDAGLGWWRRSIAAEDPFAAQHRVLAAVKMKTEDGERRVLVNEAESPLGWLRQHKAVDAAQFAAGERLRRDFTLAQLSPRLGVDYSAPSLAGKRSGPPEMHLTETVLAAKRRFAAALSAVGPGLSDLLFDVCCHLRGLDDAERVYGWPRRSAKVVLSIALDRLAAHYGLRIQAPERGKLRSWKMNADVSV
jgi:Domain of unknown function (DUF6456)